MEHITADTLRYYITTLNTYTKRHYMIRFSNGYCAIDVREKSGINTIMAGMTKRQCYTVLLSMVNMMQYELIEER